MVELLFWSFWSRSSGNLAEAQRPQVMRQHLWYFKDTASCSRIHLEGFGRNINQIAAVDSSIPDSQSAPFGNLFSIEFVLANWEKIALFAAGSANFSCSPGWLFGCKIFEAKDRRSDPMFGASSLLLSTGWSWPLPTFASLNQVQIFATLPPSVPRSSQAVKSDQRVLCRSFLKKSLYHCMFQGWYASNWKGNTNLLPERVTDENYTSIRVYWILHKHQIVWQD